MIINFVFDKLDENGNPLHNVIPFNRNYNTGWLNYRPIKEVLSSNNNIESDIKINFITVSDSLNYNNPEEINVYPVFMHIEEFEMPWPLLYLSRQIVDLVNSNRIYVGLISPYSTLYIDYERYRIEVDHFLKKSLVHNHKNIFIMATDFYCEKEFKKPLTRVHGNLVFHQMKEIEGQPKFVNANIWERIILKSLDYFNKNNINFYDLYSSKINKPYNFLFLNNIPREMRFYLYKFLEYNKSLDYGLYSYRNKDDHSRHPKWYNFSENIEEVEKINKFINENPEIESKILDDDELFLDAVNGYVDLPKNGTYINPNFIENTYFSVFCETNYSEVGSQVTEKTFKLFYYSHPFIVFGSSGILKELHNLGYETFPELFDESYDEIKNPYERLFFISKEVAKYSSIEGKEILSEKIKMVLPKLKKNRENFLSKDYNQIWKRLLD